MSVRPGALRRMRAGSGSQFARLISATLGERGMGRNGALPGGPVTGSVFHVKRDGLRELQIDGRALCAFSRETRFCH